MENTTRCRQINGHRQRERRTRQQKARHKRKTLKAKSKQSKTHQEKNNLLEIMTNMNQVGPPKDENEKQSNKMKKNFETTGKQKKQETAQQNKTIVIKNSTVYGGQNSAQQICPPEIDGSNVATVRTPQNKRSRLFRVPNIYLVGGFNPSPPPSLHIANWKIFAPLGCCFCMVGLSLTSPEVEDARQKARPGGSTARCNKWLGTTKRMPAAPNDQLSFHVPPQRLWTNTTWHPIKFRAIPLEKEASHRNIPIQKNRVEALTRSYNWDPPNVELLQSQGAKASPIKGDVGGTGNSVICRYDQGVLEPRSTQRQSTVLMCKNIDVTSWYDILFVQEKLSQYPNHKGILEIH